MVFSPELAEIRFGCGLSPVQARPQSPAAMVDALLAADVAAQAFPIEPFPAFRARLVEQKRLARAMRQADSPARQAVLKDENRARNKQTRRESILWFGQSLLRWVHTSQGFRERLVHFWADHFTAQGKRGAMTHGGLPYQEEAIRPNISGRFEDLLFDAVTHPLMVHYLDQRSSIGPGSEIAREKPNAGLNENLAREVLELHTLGVSGPYTQADVRQLAELFTGMGYLPHKGFIYRAKAAEPGAETVLGKNYGGAKARLGDVRAVLRDLARHPATAEHVATKLAVHFLSDAPPPELVAHVAARYRETRGELTEVYRALLEHPLAWEPGLQNVKPAFDYVASGCRALALSAERMTGAKPNHLKRVFLGPMKMMGQPWLRPAGPDGWSEDDSEWLSPQGQAARIGWAMSAPTRLTPDLIDPRAFLDHALGPYASPVLRRQVHGAETREEGVGLVLMSPSFQRR
ncbi:DUF1800 domain-containing protein [Falsiruegeria mediterranea]|uniref:DUF1800 domain-containing protein n=1 Tax=Falsiruegeria mediterranea M17 TaxID=1200281 RepID=A0A2R8C7J3_9RHOB|nr:DUF1800 domain-containing protein [Falsiruegeria mediterranea]SPJ28385.1 hypothetical protein TRM7615_01884 [Falsiruegeria mediterranea M17]